MTYLPGWLRRTVRSTAALHGARPSHGARLLPLAAWLNAPLALAATYHVAPAPAGNDDSAGSEAAPFASIARAQTAATAGDTVFFKGGVYAYSTGTTECESQTAVISGVVLSKSGTADNPIRYFAAPGEKPILDFDGIRDSCRIKGILLSGSFIHLRGFELRGVRQNNNLNHESWGVWVQGSNNVIEAFDIHHIMGAGVFIQRGSNNLVLNVDSHDNLDELTSNGAGESADGFGCHVRAGETGNVFRGCRAWWNADDGYDFINSDAACTVEQSWAWYNGYRPGTLEPIGNGNGFKGGGYGADPADFPATPAQHIVRQNLAVLNRAAGFYANHHPGPLTFTNNTGYGNRPNFNMLGMDRNGGDITVGVYRNNLAVNGTAFSNRDGADDADNSWSIGGVDVSDADFQDVSELGLDAARQADGSLPSLASFRLAPDSDLIDRGVDVQLAFAGAAPDLGAFETGLAAPPVPDDGAEGPGGGGGTPSDESPDLGVVPLPGDSTGGEMSGSGGAGAGRTPGGVGSPDDGALAGASGAGTSGDVSGSEPLGTNVPEGADEGCACGLPGQRSRGMLPSLALVLVMLGFARRRSSARASG